MKKAIFLDRDGVINQERKDYVKNIQEFNILNGVADAIRIIKKHGFLSIIITNQSAVNRGLLSENVLSQIHNNLQKYLNENNTSFDAVYFCPHTPEENCDCRKPKPGLILKAAKEFDIDLSKSYMIGNSHTDIEAANLSGCKGILLQQNKSLLEVVEQLFRF